LELNLLLLLPTNSISHFADDIGEDRMLALRKRAELDSKYILLFRPDEPSELKQSLHRLGSAFAELANAYYRDEGRRIKLRLEKKTFNSSSIELHVRYCFKVSGFLLSNTFRIYYLLL
jgi:hypothetical protein